MDASGMNPATAQAFEGLMQQKQVSPSCGGVSGIGKA